MSVKSRYSNELMNVAQQDINPIIDYSSSNKKEYKYII